MSASNTAPNPPASGSPAADTPGADVPGADVPGADRARVAPRRVLLATDGSAPAERAGRFLARLPFPAPPALRLMQAVDLPVGPVTYGLDADWPPLIRAVRTAKNDVLRESAASFAGFADPVTTSVPLGNPAEEALAEAGRFRADLITVGAVGAGAIERVLLGSVSDRVATHAACPVLVVRGGPGAGAAGEGDAPPSRLLLGVDGSAPSRSAAATLAAFDWPPGTAVTVLHLIRPDPPEWSFADFSEAVPAGVPGQFGAEERRRADESVRAAAGLFRGRGLDVTAEVADARHVGEALCKRAERDGADLLVVADRGHGAFTRFLVGSTSRFVLRHSPRSVWLHRNPA